MSDMTTRPHKYPVGAVMHNDLLDCDVVIDKLGADSSAKGPLYWVRDDNDEWELPYIAWEADLGVVALPGELGYELDRIQRDIEAIIAATPWWRRWLLRRVVPDVARVRADIDRRRDTALARWWRDPR